MAIAMATAANIATTTGSRPLGVAAWRLTLLMVVVGIGVSTVATMRLAAVVAASPVAVWSIVYPRLVDATVPVDPETQSRALWLSGLISDPALFRSELPLCLGDADVQTEGQTANGNGGNCLALIDDALRAAPSNGELWLFKASMMISRGDFGESTFNALRNSFRVAPVEGWIASGRVVLGLRLYSALPADLQDRVDQDLRLVLRFPTLVRPLAEAYASDSLLRASAAPVLRGLPGDLMQAFVGNIQSVLRGDR